MPNVHFYLKKPPGKLPFALIYLQFKYNGRKLVYSFGRKINPPDWSKTAKRVKSNRQTILDGQYALNETLDKLEKHCLKIYHEELEKGVPPVAVMKFRLDAFLRQQQGKKKEPLFYPLIDQFISGEVKNKGKDKSRNTLKNYATTKTHLRAFDIFSRYHIHFENVNLDFLDRYIAFLKEELKLKPNSIARDIGVLKTIMSEAVDRGYTANIQFRHKKFGYAGEETDAVLLTEKEITRLYRFDCTGTKRLEQVRDLFVYCCFTGQRLFEGRPSSPGSQPPSSPHIHSPSSPHIHSPSSASSRNKFIKLLNINDIDGIAHVALPAAGTGHPVILPCHPVLKEILLKYRTDPGHLPGSPSNQKFNDYLKQVCRLAGLRETGRLSTAPARELWESVSSRTARLTMAAYYYRQGAPVYELMRVTGHSSEKAFLKYIRVAPGH